MTTVNSKHVMHQLLRAGAFGNTLRSWKTLDAAASVLGEDGLVSMRAADGFARPCFPQMTIRLMRYMRQPGPVVFHEAPNDQELRLQGEVGEFCGDLHLTYSCLKLPMRPALRAQSRFAQGLAAREILRGYLSGSSYEDMLALLDCFPQHAVEFSAYSGCVGQLAGRNTIIWEVRAY